jgi:hypothetical protein
VVACPREGYRNHIAIPKGFAMPQIVPNRFLVRVAHPCPFVKNMPQDTD